METPIQELIEELKKEESSISDNDSQADRYYRTGIRNSIIAANSYLEKEKQAIINAYEKDMSSNGNLSFESGEQYYKETFDGN